MGPGLTRNFFFENRPTIGDLDNSPTLALIYWGRIAYCLYTYYTLVKVVKVLVILI